MKVEDRKRESMILNIIIAILVIVVVIFGGLIIKDKFFDRSEKNNNTATEIKKYDEEVKIDASLATQPLTDAYIEGLDNFNITADYSNTDPAYTKLINKEVDLIVVTEPSKEELERAKEGGVELVVTPVVNEGFVFYTNVKNPVNSLTLEQIQKIYTGEITNWKELGGEDIPIIAYQRPVNSGSQTGILSLVMKDKKMKEPTTTEYVESMAGIIDVVSNYENGKDAIGYSYYYYATAMYGNPNMKFFSVDGVFPNHDTIKDSSYPLITAYYIVTLKENDNETVKALKDAMLSSRGQKIARNAGYVELGD
ncbi:MAG: substrate-binding domain-containing protein [Bacilli bacterium]|nr:substrate-binding domain-containing protein [Bacilli bacterium]